MRTVIMIIATLYSPLAIPDGRETEAAIIIMIGVLYGVAFDILEYLKDRGTKE